MYTYRRTDKTTKLLISSNVQYVHLGRDNNNNNNNIKHASNAELTTNNKTHTKRKKDARHLQNMNTLK